MARFSCKVAEGGSHKVLIPLIGGSRPQVSVSSDASICFFVVSVTLNVI